MKSRKEKILNIKKQVKGITLIALVVTIIVLLIFAGVAINLSIGENGIFSRAKNAVNTYGQAESNELADMGKLEDYIDQYSENKHYINNIDCWGDSLTAGAGGNGISYPSILQSLLGYNYNVTNYGVGGETSATIAGRQGGVPFIVKEDFLIPENTSSVQISIESLNGEKVAPLLQGDAGVNNVIISGVEGILTYDSQKYYFSRIENGNSINVKAGTEIITNASKNNSNHTIIIWMGQNNNYENSIPLIEQCNNMINKNGNDNYIIIGIPSGSKESRNQLETDMEKEFGDKYINIREYMTKPIYDNGTLVSCQGLLDANLEPMEGDLELIKEGTIPQALRNDAVHGNSDYYRIVAKQVYDRGTKLGYWNVINNNNYTLKPTLSEVSTGKGTFLDSPNILRENINSVTFCSTLDEAYEESGKSTIEWNVDDNNQGNIKAFAKKIEGSDLYDVYIGSNGKIYANTDCSFLFRDIGSNPNASASVTINGLNNVNWSYVKNMSGMFFECGTTAMTELNFGENFDTSNVTDMNSMFYSCGYNELTSLNLGNKFDTSKVTDMSNMFNRCGYIKMQNLNLQNNFDTSSVTNMNRMFDNCGYKEMTNLVLGDKFITDNVIDMTNMFYACGNSKMEILDLGKSFKNISSNNTNIFQATGKSGSIIYCNEEIYSNPTALKLNKTSSITIVCSRNKIEAKYN